MSLLKLEKITKTYEEKYNTFESV